MMQSRAGHLGEEGICSVGRTCSREKTGVEERGGPYGGEMKVHGYRSIVEEECQTVNFIREEGERRKECPWKRMLVPEAFHLATEMM
ncbi:hypothetical protein L1987_49418 [Smallanthus sonchifolius]|uniref:Uncharacterized protein n=1 Tax=Smallanthus sonchifolius TaxID=185202 RepID=A0ACB9FUP4_9ASTR|nr:hypothetical protein L1987_49418 [Smallanthus sonchifolius]